MADTEQHMLLNDGHMSMRSQIWLLQTSMHCSMLRALIVIGNVINVYIVSDTIARIKMHGVDAAYSTKILQRYSSCL